MLSKFIIKLRLAQLVFLWNSHGTPTLLWKVRYVNPSHHLRNSPSCLTWCQNSWKLTSASHLCRFSTLLNDSFRCRLFSTCLRYRKQPFLTLQLSAARWHGYVSKLIPRQAAYIWLKPTVWIFSVTLRQMIKIQLDFSSQWRYCKEEYEFNWADFARIPAFYSCSSLFVTKAQWEAEAQTAELHPKIVKFPLKCVVDVDGGTTDA